MEREVKLALKKEDFEKFIADRGMTILQLAYKMRVDPSTIYRMIGGREVNGSTIANLINALGLSEKDFDKLFIFIPPLPKGNSDKQTV